MPLGAQYQIDPSLHTPKFNTAPQNVFQQHGSCRRAPRSSTYYERPNSPQCRTLLPRSSSTSTTGTPTGTIQTPSPSPRTPGHVRRRRGGGLGAGTVVHHEGGQQNQRRTRRCGTPLLRPGSRNATAARRKSLEPWTTTSCRTGRFPPRRRGGSSSRLGSRA